MAVNLEELTAETKRKLGLGTADRVVSPRISLLSRILLATSESSQREALWALARAKELIGKANDADRNQRLRGKRGAHEGESDNVEG